MTMPPSQEDSALPITGGPGAELRRAREAKGIERARISLQLHLSDATIEALERDDYQHMPGIVFARGYVRKYARLLNLDENALVAQFNQVCPEHVEPLHLTQTTFNEPTRTSYRPARGRRGLLPIAGMLVLLLLIGAGIALWMRVDDAPQPAAIEAPTDNSNLLDRLEPTTPPAEGPQSDEDGLPWPGDMIKRFTDGEDSGSLTLPPAPENYNAEEPPPATGPGPDSGQAESEPPAGQPAKDDNSATTVSAAEAIVESAEPASPATATGNTSSSAIILDFSAACWVDIRDSAGDQVLVGEFQPGEQRRLQGIPPFSVLIGNAPAVRVSVDGQPFDLAPHTRGRVARMTLDPTQN